MGNLNNQTWDELWNSPEAEKVRAKVRCCDRDCWMIGSVSPAMHKYIWKPATWVLVHKFKALFTKHPYSMYELKICRDYRDGKVTKEELDKCSTCDMNCVINNGLSEASKEQLKGSEIGERCRISIANSLDIGEKVLLSPNVYITDCDHAKANFPGHQALVCTHMDGHNGSGNIHVHIVINSLRKLDVPKQPFMERPIDCKAGYKHHVTNEYLKHLQKSLMDLCQREFLHQVDLLSPSRTGVIEAEYWAQRRLDEKKQEIEKEGFTPNPTKFQTQKQLIRDAVAAAREKAISYEDFQDILQDEYDVFVKTQRGRYSYLPPERNKFISERSLGDSCKRECLEGFFVQNAEKNQRYKEDPMCTVSRKHGICSAAIGQVERFTMF